MLFLKDLMTVFGGLPGAAMATVILLAGFALAAFAIYAVLIVTKERR